MIPDNPPLKIFAQINCDVRILTFESEKKKVQTNEGQNLNILTLTVYLSEDF